MAASRRNSAVPVKPVVVRADLARPGRPRKLTHEQIIRAALTLIERDGFAALSTRSLARELGITGSTLYNYVERVEDIEVEVLRIITSDIPLPTAKTGPALRAEFLNHLLAVRRLVLKHPRVPFPEYDSPSWNLLNEINAKWYAALAPFVPQPHLVVLAYSALISNVVASAERERISGPVVRQPKSAQPYLRDVKLETVEIVLGLLIDQLLPGLGASR